MENRFVCKLAARFDILSMGREYNAASFFNSRIFQILRFSTELHSVQPDVSLYTNLGELGEMTKLQAVMETREFVFPSIKPFILLPKHSTNDTFLFGVQELIFNRRKLGIFFKKRMIKYRLP